MVAKLLRSRRLTKSGCGLVPTGTLIDLTHTTGHQASLQPHHSVILATSRGGGGRSLPLEEPGDAEAGLVGVDEAQAAAAQRVGLERLGERRHQSRDVPCQRAEATERQRRLDPATGTGGMASLSGTGGHFDIGWEVDLRCP
jgi:hypothetical protein